MKKSIDEKDEKGKKEHFKLLQLLRKVFHESSLSQSTIWKIIVFKGRHWSDLLYVTSLFKCDRRSSAFSDNCIKFEKLSYCSIKVLINARELPKYIYYCSMLFWGGEKKIQTTFKKEFIVLTFDCCRYYMTFS